MMKKGHVELLKQGVAQWNEWREQHQEISPDLFGARLSSIDLVNANLDDTILSCADLSQAN